MAEQQAWQQAHVDIGALAQRVSGLESGFIDLRAAIHDLGKKLDTKPTNWWAILGGLMAVLSVIGTAIGMLLSPINYNIERHEREIRAMITEHNQDFQKMLEHSVAKDRYDRDHDEQERWIASLRDRVRANEDRGVFKDDLLRLESVVTKLIEAAATRAEVADGARRTDDRFNALSANLNEIRHDLYITRSAVPLPPLPPLPPSK